MEVQGLACRNEPAFAETVVCVEISGPEGAVAGEDHDERELAAVRWQFLS